MTFVHADVHFRHPFLQEHFAPQEPLHPQIMILTSSEGPASASFMMGIYLMLDNFHPQCSGSLSTSLRSFQTAV